MCRDSPLLCCACVREQFDDENWLDLRRLDLIAPIMLARLDVMAAKGCDAVEWDNADLQEQSVRRMVAEMRVETTRYIKIRSHYRGTRGEQIRPSMMFRLALRVHSTDSVMGSFLADGPAHQLERPDGVQPVAGGADARPRDGSGDEEQQPGRIFPRGGLRHGGRRGVLDLWVLPQLRETLFLLLLL